MGRAVCWLRCRVLEWTWVSETFLRNRAVCKGLSATLAVERNVLLALQSPFGVPFGFPVSGDDQAMRASIAYEFGEICLIALVSRGGIHDSGGLPDP